ncbi:hypothetical protein BgiMline_021769, partial [Biomphalaria glabrata]
LPADDGDSKVPVWSRSLPIVHPLHALLGELNRDCNTIEWSTDGRGETDNARGVDTSGLPAEMEWDTAPQGSEAIASQNVDDNNV